MKTLISAALKFEHGKLWALNQQALPQRKEWLSSHTIEEMCEIIYSLKVRGAPLIGVAAALDLAHCVDRLLEVYTNTHTKAAMIHEAETIFMEDAELCRKIVQNGERLIQANDRILTHCNTGELVTTGVGTALGIIIQAHRQGKNPHVYVDETRPLLQGGRITAWECVQHGISH